jgi:hypothetical protein
VRTRIAQGVLLAATVAAAFPLPASAQAPTAQKAAPAKPAAPPAPQNAQPARLPVPPAETLVLLIRMSLLTLNDALQTGNYTVLRDRGSPAFREANSAAKLARIFSQLESKGIDLALVTIRAPQLTEAAVTDPGQRLRVKGFFPGQPTQLDFDLAYEPVNGHWQLFGISVAEAPAVAQAAAPQKTAPAQKPAPAKK